MGTNGGLEEMEAVANNWDELIKRRAISDLYKIVTKCNDEISKVVEEFRLRLANATRELDGYQYTSEQFMQIEAALYRCKDYFRMEQEKSLEEYMAIAIVAETELVETEFTADIVDQTLCYEYDEGTTLALRLIDKYVEALKHKVIDSASGDLLAKEDANE